MKSFKIHTIVLLACILLCAKNSFAQKEGNVQQLKELPKSVAHITPEIEKQIVDIVKPVKEKIEKLFNEDITGTAKTYASDMEKINKITDVTDKMQQLKNLEKKYYPFIKNTWALAKIDEADYQQKLRSIFPSHVKETIRFGEFLNFSMSSGNQKPAPPPAPVNICVDANAMFAGSFATGGGPIGGARVQVAPARPPSPAEIVTSTNSVALGVFAAQGWIRNTISIPGTFPLDAKSVRSKKTFDWRGNATAFTFLGCSWATVAFSTNPDSDFSVGGETHSIVTPVTFILWINERTAMTEETVIPKTNLPAIRFGITCFASSSTSLFLSFSHSSSTCALTQWQVCEE